MPKVAPLSFEPATTSPEDLLSFSWDARMCTGQGSRLQLALQGTSGLSLADLGKDFSWFCSGRGWS